MIGRLNGIIIEKKPPILLLEVGGGIGYEVLLPLNNFYSLPEVGEKITLQTHMVVREDSHALYGFVDEKQKFLFRTLIKVNGVGPKMALNILSNTETDVFIHCILDSDDSNLVKLPGIGKKMAQRLIIELRNVLEPLPNDFGIGKLDCSDTVRDAISALIALGYKPNDAHKVVAKHKDKNMSREDLIKTALKDINKK